MLQVLKRRHAAMMMADAEPDSPETRPAHPTIGLALGSGVARGWAQIGILRVLEREGIRPKVIAGTSVGAVVGGNWVAGTLDQLEIFARRLTRRSVFGLMDLSFTGSGLVGGRRLRDMLDEALRDRTIEHLPTRFAAVTTEYGTGHEVWLTRGHLATAIRASYAIPGIFEPVKVAGRWLIDGALVNPIPVSTARAMGADLVIAVNLNADQIGRSTVIADHVAEPHNTEPASAGTGLLQPVRGVAQAMSQYFSGKTAMPDGAPSIAAVMVDAINITQDRIARSRLAGDPPDVTIAPRLGRIGLFEFHRADEAIAIGAEAAEKMLPEIREAFAVLSERR